MVSLCAAVMLSLLMMPAVSAWASGGGGGGGGAEADEYKPLVYKNGVKAIKDHDYKTAIDLMTQAVAKTPKDPDAYNWLGYAYRKLKDYDNAIKNYELALQLDPDHRGAHEYLGEAYLELNKLDEAKKQLAVLDKICWLPCNEYSDLKDAVQMYEKKAKT
jgi:tetratricopeptide (TPR) repeat protein